MKITFPKNQKVRTRFAPSPTGHLHIGGLRTALYAYAFAKSLNGKFILRIEDTDRKRFVSGADSEIYDMLKTFGLKWDEGPLVGGPFEPYIQSERTAKTIYKEFAEQIVKDGHAYYCFCKPDTSEDEEEENYSKKNLRDICRDLKETDIEEKLKAGIKPAIRLKVPEEKRIVEYHDFVVNNKDEGKKIGWLTEVIDDVMLLKSDGFPTYHLGVVVDDHLMEVSHIIRGHDWMPSTPAHLLIYEFLGWEVPFIGHLTDILDPEGGKLSKRKGSVSCVEFLKEGYLPEAILNFIMLLGWAPKDNREIFSLEEFVEEFSKGDFQISNPIFNREKLDWFNGYYLRKKSDSELFELLIPFLPKDFDEKVAKASIPLVKERINKLSDYQVLAGFLFEEKEVDLALLNERAKDQIEESLKILEKTEWSKEMIETNLNNLIQEKGWKVGDFFMNFRIAITGAKFTPPITDSIVILGKEETLKRLKNILSKL